MKVKKGDRVQVIAGHSKGLIGDIVAVLPRSNRVIVEGANIATKHEKPGGMNPDGGIVNKEMPINASNVMLYDEKTKKPTRKAAEARSSKKAKKGGKKK